MSDHEPGPLPPPTGAAGPPPGATGTPDAPWWRRRVLLLPMWAWGVLGVAGVAGGAQLLLGGGDAPVAEESDTPVTVLTTVQRATPQTNGPIGTFDPSLSETTTSTLVSPSTASSSTPSTVGATPASTAASTTVATATTTTPPTTTVPTTTTTPTTTVPTTTVPTTTTRPTTTPTTTVPTTTTTPTTTAPPTTTPPTTVPPDGPYVAITPRREPCRYGSDCLVAGFAISGFDHEPDQFVCEFSSGARYVFRFDSLAVDLACSTADSPDTITIEVEGVRSATVSTADVGR